MLAYYLEWHLREALAPVLSTDEESALAERLVCVSGICTESSLAERLVCVPGVSTESSLAERLVCVPGVSTESSLAERLVCVPGVSTESSLAERLVCVPGVSTELDATGRTRDPVKPAVASKLAKGKKTTKWGKDGTSLHSLSTLLTDLSTLCCNRCRLGDPGTGIPVNRFTEDTPFQEQVFELLNLQPVT